jgi:hypothetical protein
MGAEPLDYLIIWKQRPKAVDLWRKWGENKVGATLRMIEVKSMKKVIQVFGGALAALTLTPAVVAAQTFSLRGWFNWGGHGGHSGGGTSTTPVSVPEIDAASGTMALAALGAAMLLCWEISRRRKANR